MQVFTSSGTVLLMVRKSEYISNQDPPVIEAPKGQRPISTGYVLGTIQYFLCKLGMKPAIGNHNFFTKTCHRQTYQNY